MISINGKTYFGSSISIKRNKIVIDGKVIEDDDQKQINITINGDIQTLDVDSCEKINITGNVDQLRTISGDVRVNGVSNSVSTTSGDVGVEGNVGGSVTTVSGDVDVEGNINGSVKTVSGDIT